MGRIERAKELGIGEREREREDKTALVEMRNEETEALKYNLVVNVIFNLDINLFLLTCLTVGWGSCLKCASGDMPV